MTLRIEHGCCLEIMRALATEGMQVDSVVTDPPAGISFMNRAWDGDHGGRDAWIAQMSEIAAAALALCKPGAHALVWALPRTSHWTATAWENAGWQVRDRVAHLFASGFPKSHNIGKAIDKAAGAEREVIAVAGRSGSSRACMAGDFAGGDYHATVPATDAARQWQGWGTALKPAVEDWWLLRKPLAAPTIAANVLKHGTGALNIDGCRVPIGEGDATGTWSASDGWEGRTRNSGFALGGGRKHNAGRWPANLCHDGSAEVLEAFAAYGQSTSSAQPRRNTAAAHNRTGSMGKFSADWVGTGHTDTGSAARFFFSAKAGEDDRTDSKHPTIKPVALMRWLARLVTPPKGTILDPFAGSGTTGVACIREGFNAILIERDDQYHEDILHRIAKLSGLDAPLFEGLR